MGRSGPGAFEAVASDGAGGALVAWADMRNGVHADIYVQRLASPSPGHPAVPRWTSNGVPVCTAAGKQDTAVVVSDGAGGAILAWEDHRGGYGPKVYTQRVDAAGVPQWASNGVALCTASGEQQRPTILSDGAGGAIVAWTDARAYPETDIYAQHVSAAGERLWVDSGVAVCTAAGSQRGVVSAPGDSGSAILVWLDRRVWNVDGVSAARIASDGVARWTADGVQVHTDGTMAFPAVAADGAGGALIAWGDGRGPRIYAQRLDASGSALWTAGGVDAAPVVHLFGPFAPAIVSDGAGGAIVASDGFAQRVDASGSTLWGADGVQVVIGSVAAAAAVADGAGGAIVAWGQCVQRVDATGALLWPAPFVVLSPWPRSPQDAIVPDGAGGAILVWKDYRDQEGGVDVYAQHLDANGVAQWTDHGVPVYLSAGLRKHPVCVGDGAGNVIAVWEEKRGGTYAILACKTDGQNREVWPAVGLCDATVTQVMPLAVSDGAGGAVVAWTDWRDGVPNIYVQRVSAAGVPLWDGGGVLLRAGSAGPVPTAMVPDGSGGAFLAWQESAWPSPSGVKVGHVDDDGDVSWSVFGVPVWVSDRDQSQAALAPDGSGGVIVAWLEDREFAGRNVYAQRLDASGARLWDPAGEALRSAPADQSKVALVPDGAGGAIAAWAGYTTVPVIGVQRVGSDGEPLWTADGVILVSDGYGASNPVIVGDGAGGAVVAWLDGRLDAEYYTQTGIYAQRVGPSGTVRWVAGGVQLHASRSYWHDGPALLADGGGGAIAVWQEWRNVFEPVPAPDLHAQRVDSTGAVLWPADGAPVCAAAGVQTLPAMTTDGASGVFVLWQDSRDPTRDDVYTLRLLSDGTVATGWDSGGVTATLVSLLEVDARPGRVRLVWSLTGGGTGATIYRHRGGAGWARMGYSLSDGTGRLRFEDCDVTAGERVGYRLGLSEDGVETMAGETWVDVPVSVFSLEGARPNPASDGRLAVRFTLPSAEPAQLEVLDVAGRRVTFHDLVGLGAGAHEFTVDAVRVWRPGVYLVRLQQSGRSLVSRIVLMR
jgi:hypothetical protein